MIFTHRHYRLTLETALSEGYRFSSFSRIDETRTERGHIFLRHDLDNDLVATLEMAKIEHSLGVRSTYFFFLHSHLYNLWNQTNLSLAKQILELGHDCGLHYSEFDQIAGTHEESVEFETHLLERLVGQKVKFVSLHQPTKEMMRRESGFRHTYEFGNFSHLDYFSDSCMTFSKGDPIEFIQSLSKQSFQMLIHPEWWREDVGDVADRWMKMYQNNFDLTQRHLMQTERQYAQFKSLELIAHESQPTKPGLKK